MEKSEFYDSDMETFVHMRKMLETGEFCDADCDLFGTILRSVEKDTAIELLRVVAQRCPRIGFPYEYLGLMLLEEGKVEEAKELFDKAIAINFEHAWYINLKLEEYYQAAGDEAMAGKYRELKDYASANRQFNWNYDYAEETGDVVYPADWEYNKGMLARSNSA